MLRDAQYRVSAIAFTAALLLLVAACGPYPRPAVGPDFDRGDEPLRVWLTDTPDATPSPFTAFHVNRPAYVAIFDIRPGAGVRAVYPWDASGAGHPVPAGLRSVMPFEAAHGVRPHRFGYGAYGTSSFAAFGSCASALHSPVVWRLIIASERPLRLERLVGDVAFSFRPALHTRSFAVGNAFDIMDAIVSRAVPGALAGGDLAAGGQWDVYWTSGWAAGDCQRPLLPLPRLVLGDDPWSGPDPAEGADDGDDGDGLDDGEAKVVDGFRVPRTPVATDRPAVTWNGAEQGDDASGDASAEARPAPPALLRGPETRAATPRLVDWRRQTGPAFDRRDRAGDRDRGFRVRPLRRGWGEVGGGMRFRSHARPDRGHERRVDSPAPVRRSPAPRPVRRGSDGDSDRPDKPTDSGGGA